MRTTLFAMFVALGAIAGAAIASYAGVVAGRGWRASATGRSLCDACGRPLRWWELFPVASYLVLRGRCSRCASRIPRSLLATELAGALVGGCVATMVVAIAGR